MHSSPDIFALAYKQPFMQHELELLYATESVKKAATPYSIKRYRKQPQWNIDDTAVLVYHYQKENPSENYLELKFCISGNIYCRQKQTSCDSCKFDSSKNCVQKVESVDVLNFTFQPEYLSRFTATAAQSSFTENVLSFTHNSSFWKQLPLCGKTKTIIDLLLSHTYTHSLQEIFIQAQTQMLLLYSLDCMISEREEGFACKFLSNAEEREKIIKAREILLQNISEPITIKALSRKVAINECYLKKGFKEIFGTTIFDFYQTERMKHAHYLLYDKGLTVTEVSVMLGYSSISHFSTAFKKHTGIKPCELLLH